MNSQIYKSPAGNLLITADGKHIKSIRPCIKEEERPSPLTDKAAKQLSEYFEGARKSFSLPLSPDGTAFQKRVWAQIQSIPYGETVSYGEIAEAVGGKGCARAVGNAANKNPVIIVIPCHRVVGANGKLTGYNYGTEMKRFLLETEKKNVIQKK